MVGLKQGLHKIQAVMTHTASFFKGFRMKKFAVGFSIAMVAFGASANVLDFENIPYTQFQANIISGYSLANTNAFGSNYGNLKWSQNGNINDFRIVEAAGFLARNPGTPANNGITNGLVSGSWVAVNGGGGDVWFETLTPTAANFNLNSAYMSAAWYSGLKVDITGYRDGVQVYSMTTNPLNFTAGLVTFNWHDLDKVTFHSQQNSGTVIDNQSTYNHAFVMDNLNVSPVPEPEALAMWAGGLGLLGAALRKKKPIPKNPV